LVPPTPSELSAARRGSLLRGHGRSSVLTKNGLAAKSMIGFGRRSAGSAAAAHAAQRLTDLDQAGDAGRGVEVADVGLHRADARRSRASGRAAVGLRERGDLDRVAHLRAGAVRLDVQADRRRIDARQRERLGDHRRVAVDAGRQVADLAGAVVVDRRRLDHRVDRVAVGERVGEAAQRHDAGAAAEHRALAAAVERAAMAVGREDLVLRTGSHGDAAARSSRRRRAPCRTPASRLWTPGARRPATSSTRSARPRSGRAGSEQYDTRVGRKSLSLPVWRSRNRPTLSSSSDCVSTL
jgi:hypothetical protein